MGGGSLLSHQSAGAEQLRCALVFFLGSISLSLFVIFLFITIIMSECLRDAQLLADNSTVLAATGEKVIS